MITLIVSPRARLDLLAIIHHLTSAAGPVVADTWDRRLWRNIDRLAEFPGSGAPRPRLGHDVRIVPVIPYLLIYHHVLGSDSVAILRVVHGRRRITRRLARET
jgi:toxin ParE1/3/4